MTETKKYYHARYRFKSDNIDHSIILDIHPYEWVKKENKRTKKENDEIINEWEIEGDKLKEQLDTLIKEAKKLSMWKRGFKSADEYVWDKHCYSLIDNECLEDELKPYINFIDWKEISEREYRLGLEAFRIKAKR